MAEEQHFNGDFSSQRHQFIGSHFYGSVTIDSSGRGDEDELTWDSCAQSLAFEGSRLREAVIDRHTDGTCEWLFQSPAYLRWVEQHGILLIRGNPGCGKSTLLKFALGRQQEEAASTDGLTLSFFFYSNGTELQRSMAGFTRFLLLQLCQQDVSAQSSFHEICRKRWMDEGKQTELLEWHPKELQDIFERLVLECSTRRKTTLLIDAVDECRDEDRDALIRLFHRLKGKTQPRLDRPRVFLACRLYPDALIDQDFLIRLEETNQDDIQSFVDQELRLPDETESAVNSLKRVLCAKADGIFLWLVLVIQQVHVMSSKGLNLKFIESEILKSPHELDGLYEDLINRIEDTDLVEAGKLFQWVCFTGRHLSLDELRIAMTVYLTGTRKFLAEYEDESNPHYIMNDRKMKKRMVYLSRGLVGITNPLAVEGSSIVGFYHETIERFMLNKGFLQLNSRLTDYPSLTETAHFQLANTCIDYLSTEEIHSAVSEGQKRLGTFCFLDYATTNWLSHGIKAEHAGSGENVKWPCQETIDLWVTIFRALKTNSTWVPEEGTSLMHIAAENGLDRLAKSLYGGTSLEVITTSTTAKSILRGLYCVPRIVANLGRIFKMPLDVSFSFHIRPITATILTPLYALKLRVWRALENYGRLRSKDHLIEEPKRQETQGSETQLAVSFSMEQSCLSNAKNKAGDTPLHLAARYGSIDMAKLLHKHDSSTEAVNADSCNALHLASDNGHLQVVKFLHEKGMDTDMRITTVDGSTHLYSASWNGHLEVVKFLYKHGAEADIRKHENNGFTPFYCASRNGHLDIVKFLYENGAAEDLCKRSRDGLTPFYGASKHGQLHVVEFLYSLGADADIHTPTYQGLTPLYSASDNGHSEVVKFLFRHGADVDIDTPTENGLTPLYAASCNGHLDVVKFLCENGANVTATTDYGWTAINAASARGHIKVVELLFDNGADGCIHKAANDGWTPIAAASSDGHLDVVRFLFDHGADRYIDTVRPDRSTALHSASGNGHTEVVRLLIAKGADITVVNDHGWTPLHAASKNGHLDISRMLIEKGACVNLGNKDGWTPLYEASFHGHLDVCRLLLDNDADAFAKNNHDCDPLHAASSQGHLDICKLLLETGSSTHNKNKDGWTPLHEAANHGHLDISKLLLENGSHIDTSNNLGLTPLHEASFHGHLGICRLLLENGADINAFTDHDWSPLHAASTNGSTRVVKLLLEKGAHIDMRDKDESTPLHAASYFGHANISRLLLENGADVHSKNDHGWTPLHGASNGGSTQIAKLLLEKGARPNIAAIDGWTPLHHASNNEHFDICQLLVENGADLTLENDHGWTPLHVACMKGSLQIAKLLLEKGARTDVGNKDGWTPLHEASFHGHLDISRLLLENGADQNSTDHEGRTPVFLASEKGHLSVVQLLSAREQHTVVINDGQRSVAAVSERGENRVVEVVE